MKIVYIICIFLFSFTLGAKEVKVASYNVENLFDLKYDGTEYKEYRPHTPTWDKVAYQNKLNNIARVLNELDADIIALQEVESTKALQDLLKLTPQYKNHYKFLKNPSSAVGIALLSRYPILSSTAIKVDKSDKHSRDILKTVIQIEGHPLTIYTNHWRSKKAPESKRIIYALALKNEIDTLEKYEDYIILGDLNSNYNEFETFKYDKKLNDSFGITGINQILNTTVDKNFVTLETILETNENLHYNLWLDYKQEKFSSIFRQQNNTPDNIIVSKGLFDAKGFSYVPQSFQVFSPNYLLKNRKLQRWDMKKKDGYSDHLPVFATFSTTPQNYKAIPLYTKKENTIKELYEIQNISNYILHNVVVIYHKNKRAIITKENDMAIMIYNPPSTLQEGYRYHLVVDGIDLYHGIKEITKISNITPLKEEKTYQNFYLEGKDTNLLDSTNQNHIITNLEGVYKKGYLYFKKDSKEEKIKLYFHKDLQKPKDDTKIRIISGHLTLYKSQMQIALYRKEDFN